MKIKQANAYAMHALMYMVRHATQLPVSVHAIAKAERIPYRQLMRIFRQMEEARIVKATDGTRNGYVFDRTPSEVTLLELFHLIEGKPIFDECFMKYCDCKGTTEDCTIYAVWKKGTAAVAHQLSEISIEQAAWNHPSHHF